MHIAIDARIVNSSTGRYVERLLHYLEQIDTTNRYTVLVPTKDISYWTPTNQNFTVKGIDFDNYSLSEQTGFKRYLKKLAPDLVHFCMPQQPALYKGKHVTTFHDLSLLKTYNSDKNWFMFHFKQFVGRFIFNKVAHTSDHIIAISQYTKDDLMKFSGIDEGKITITYEAAEITNDASKRYKHEFKRYLLYVGSESDYKNIKRLGDAHQRLLKKYPDLGLILAGKKNAGVLTNEEYFVKRKYKNILFTDFVAEDQLNWLYTHADAYVFPSLMEGFGLPGLEAMTHGTPVVSSSATCLPEIYGKAAHYFDPSDVTDMARAIDEVLANEKLRLELVKNGYKQIKKYSWKRMAEQTHDVYMKVLKIKN
jgi:glycosyltransferase involved in cell wall biosynthesis